MKKTLKKYLVNHTNTHAHKTRRPSETFASCRGSEPRGGRRGIEPGGRGGGGANKNRKLDKSYTVDTMWKMGKTINIRNINSLLIGR